MDRVVRVSLNGGDARLGHVRARDVARMLLGAETVVARASGVVLQQRLKSTGRWRKVTADAVRFRLIGIEPGSVVGVLELPDIESTTDQLELHGTTLGEAALVAALHTAAGDDDEPDVARALHRMTAELHIGTRYDSVTFETGIPGAPQKVTLDQAARSRLEEIMQAAHEHRDDTLVGVLFEADFESFTARLRAADGRAVVVTFDEGQADAVKQALRGRAELIGTITYDPLTSQATKVEVGTISAGEQLGMDLTTEDFWADVTVEDLQHEQGVGPVSDPSALAASDLSDDEADELLAAFGS